MLHRIHPSSTDELRAKNVWDSEPKYSFTELSDEEEDSGNLFRFVFAVLCCSLTSSKIDEGVVVINPIHEASYF